MNTIKRVVLLTMIMFCTPSIQAWPSFSFDCTKAKQCITHTAKYTQELWDTTATKTKISCVAAGLLVAGIWTCNYVIQQLQIKQKLKKLDYFVQSRQKINNPAADQAIQNLTLWVDRIKTGQYCPKNFFIFWETIGHKKVMELLALCTPRQTIALANLVDKQPYKLIAALKNLATEQGKAYIATLV